MKKNIVIETPRLLLRHWMEKDKALFADINADQEVMRYLPQVLTRDESDYLLTAVIIKGIKTNKIGFWAVEIKDSGCFIGFVGMAPVSCDLPFAPNIEIGWRLARCAWGQGYASEAALACLKFGFIKYHFSEIVSFTTVENQRSRAVMHRIGMTYDMADDFEHPAFMLGHPLGPHVLYRIRNPCA